MYSISDMELFSRTTITKLLNVLWKIPFGRTNVLLQWCDLQMERRLGGFLLMQNFIIVMPVLREWSMGPGLDRHYDICANGNVIISSRNWVVVKNMFMLFGWVWVEGAIACACSRKTSQLKFLEAPRGSAAPSWLACIIVCISHHPGSSWEFLLCIRDSQ